MSRTTHETIGEPLLFQSRALDFTEVYREWFDPVVAWLRALGTPESELEDVAQETFLVVRRKLDGFDGGNLPAWLYRIASNTASDQRRRAWFRRLVKRAPEAELERVRSDTPDPLRACEQARAQDELRVLLSRLKEPHRVAFWLLEIEGYRTAEIAGLLGVSDATVSMRVHYARKALYRMVAKQRKEPS
jgi:RNA polymerase sigma-70 factor (ECF subfamily)